MNWLPISRISMRWLCNLADFKKDHAQLFFWGVAVGVFLLLLGWSLSVLKPPLDENGVETYTDISSFMGVMIPLNLIGNLEGFRKWIADYLSHRRDAFVSCCAKIPHDGFAESFSGLVQIAVEPYTQLHDANDQLLLSWTNRIGLIFAVITTVLFVTGVYPCVKPYLVLIAWPMLFYAVLTYFNGLAWNKKFVYVCENMIASPVDPAEALPCDDHGDIASIKEGIV